MRKLLVVSQKGGVGKTTASMNLAAAAAAGTRVLLLDADPLSNVSTALRLGEHPRQQTLRQASIDLPGVLVANLVPGLDVLSPYEGGSCSDEELERLLRVLTQTSVQQCYGCMIVDVPPFLGGNPMQLLGSCDDFLLVMRAEAMAYRTLPALLELVQRCSGSGRALPMRGILLTLAQGEEPGGHWERELRGRFGPRALPEVIPHDETIDRALQSGHIGSHLSPDSPAARQYRQLAESLGLATEARPSLADEQLLQALREAEQTANKREACPKGAAPPQPPVKPATPSSSRLRRVNRPLGSPATTPPFRMKIVPAQAPSAAESSRPIAMPSVPQTSALALAQLWPLWILLGAILGGGLRFVPLTAALLPVLIGLGVALLVIVTVLGLLAAGERLSVSSTPGAAAPSQPKKITPPSPQRKVSVNARLTSLTSSSRRPPRDTDAN